MVLLLCCCFFFCCFVFFQAEDGIRDLVRSRGLGDVYKRQDVGLAATVRADHANQVRRETDRGRVHERLETGQLDLGQTLSLIHI